MFNRLWLIEIEYGQHICFNLGRASAMAQYFHGQLSGLVIEQKKEIEPTNTCIRDCQQYLDMPDIQSQSDIVCLWEFLSKEKNKCMI